MLEKETINELVLTWEDALKGGLRFLKQTEEVYGKLDPSSPVASTVHDLMYGATAILAASVRVDVSLFEEWAYECGFGKHWMKAPPDTTIKTTDDLVDYVFRAHCWH